MKSILCYGDSNTWGCPPRRHFGEVPRYGPDVRWPGVLRTALGSDCTVVEEGLGGRTTRVEAECPIEGEQQNGGTYLVPCLASHRPLDLVIVMLGTNDLKHRFGLSAADIAARRGLAGAISSHASGAGPAGGRPAVLLVLSAPDCRPRPLRRNVRGRDGEVTATGPPLRARPPRAGARSSTPGASSAPATSTAFTSMSTRTRHWAA